MEILSLDIGQIREIYLKQMVRDFPRNERKPLNRILEAVGAGTYECYGLFDSTELNGYAFFVRHGDDYLFDYFAILPEKRDKGIGSLFLQLLSKRFSSVKSLIGEIEDPSFAETEAERQIRERRKRFYLKNGYSESGVSVKTFGVHYLLVSAPIGDSLGAEDVRTLYLKHYREMLPPFIFRTYVSAGS